jgi:transcription elongation GreA/GreB family factor
MNSSITTLSKEEKYFLACFYCGQVDLLQPKYKEWLSLYSYLDNTHESQRIQKKFNTNEDDIISASLRRIGSNVDNEIILKEQIKLLRELKICINSVFLKRYTNSAKWFWYEESNTYIYKVSNDSQAKLNALKEERRHNAIKNKWIIEKNYRIAMFKLSTNTFKINKNTNSKKSKSNSLEVREKNEELNQTVAEAIENKKIYLTYQGIIFFNKLRTTLKNKRNQLFEKDKHYGYHSKEIIDIDSEISKLENNLFGSIEVNSSAHHGSNVVRFGAIVSLDNLTRIKLVGAIECDYQYELKNELAEDATIQYVNWASPLGRDLIGKKIGDEVLVGIGEIKYKITSIKYSS